MTDRIVLPPNWYTYVRHTGVDESKPGIYEWKIEGVGSYIGKYKRISRPTKHYTRNVERKLNGEYYRRGNPDGFRFIHEELEKAHLNDRPIELHILENVELRSINAREAELINERGLLNRTGQYVPKPA